jgi:Arc/MetJ-type ribon-helix-helix transcriptional regulator
MPVQLKPETEKLVQEEISIGHFHSVDELITEGVYAWREKHQVEQRQVSQKPLKNLAQVLLDSPFAGSDLDLEREKDYGRTVDL